MARSLQQAVGDEEAVAAHVDQASTGREWSCGLMDQQLPLPAAEVRSYAGAGCQLIVRRRCLLASCSSLSGLQARRRGWNSRCDLVERGREQVLASFGCFQVGGGVELAAAGA